MQTTIPTVFDPLWQQISDRIECRTGLHFPPARFADLERGLTQAAREAGCRNTRAFAESLLSRDLRVADLEALAGSLTIGETHFFRNPRAFEFLENTLLPELIAAKRGGDRRLRIWSAGCASGEEPYSIAILLHRLIPDLSDWHITILGTDINPRVLARAAAGVYTEWSFRDTPAWVKPRYFVTRPGGRYALQPWLKRMLSFACLNLADDDYPSVMNNTNAMDLIICLNVLLYFTPARIPQVGQRFHRALIDGGQLALGVIEASQIKFPGLTPVPAPGVALFRKNGAATPQAPAPPLEVAPACDFLGNHSLTLPSRVQEVAKDSALESQATKNATSQSQASGAAPPANRRDVYAEAKKLYDAGRYRDVRAMLAAGTYRLRDNDPQVAALLAQCHANLGELAEALVWCERALAAAKTDAALHFLRAGVLQELGRDEEALLALRNVLFLDPGHVLAHFTTANLQRRRNRMPVAVKHLANVRRLLAHRDANEELPQSGGLTVGRLNAILAATMGPAEEKKGTTHE